MSIAAEFWSLPRDRTLQELKRVPVLGEISPLARFECMSRLHVQQVGSN